MDDLTTREDERTRRSLSAEMAVIGSLCVDPEPVAGIVFHKLRPEDFGNAAYRKIFKAALQIWLERRSVDLVLLSASLDKEYEQTIVDAMEMTPTAANVELYADIVIEEAKLRRLRDIGAQLSLRLESVAEGLKILAEAEELMTRQSTERVYTYRDMLERYLVIHGSIVFRMLHDQHTVIGKQVSAADQLGRIPCQIRHDPVRGIHEYNIKFFSL